PADSVVLLPVSSHQASAFPPLAQGRLLSFSREAISTRGTFSGLQSFLYVQASIFACHPGRSYRYDLSSYGSRDFYFRAPQGSLPHPASDMLAVRIGQLTAGDFHPIRFAALSAASVKVGTLGSRGVTGRVCLLDDHRIISPYDLGAIRKADGDPSRTNRKAGYSA